MHTSSDRRQLLPLLLLPLVASAAVTPGRNKNELNVDSSSISRGFLDGVVGVLVDSQILNKEDAAVIDRHGRDNPLSELAFDVFKEVVAEFLTATLGNYLGVATRRTSEDDSLNLISMVMSAVRKNTIQKRMGCPT